MSLAGLALVLLLAAPSVPAGAPEISVTAEQIEGQQWWTVRAREASLEKVLREIGTRSGRAVEGLATLERPALVTVELTRRPLEQVLDYVLGSVGLRFELRRGTITVVAGEASRDELLDLASASWLRARTRFPDAPEAPSARLAEAELAERRGNLGAARDHYQSLVESYPLAREVTEAYFRSGRILERLGRWSDASLQFRTLANHPEASAWQSAARLELARCTVELGDPQSALHILTALESAHPSADETERSARILVEAHALNARGRFMEALRALDAVGTRLDPLAEREALRVRAVALEGIGLPGEAGRAWLLYAHEALLPERAAAYEHAARLALVADDELGALFVCEEAARAGLDGELGRYRREARQRLGFDAPAAAGPRSTSERLAHAEELVDGEDFAGALPELEALFAARGALDDPDAARVAVSLARCLERSESLDAALATLAAARADLASLQARARLDVAAAKLLESHELFERAIDAYRGEY